jgi:Flp pilus assembly protein TadB
VLFIIVAVVARPGYLSPLVTTAFGALMLITASILFIIGIFWLRAVTKVEV